MTNRTYVHEGKVYIIRDVEGGCEYATLTADGAQLSWQPCEEGADFKDIEPLAEVRE